MNVFVCSTMGSCESNQFYTTKIFNYVKENGHFPTWTAAQADIIMIVTCGFDDEREDKAIETCEFYAGRYPGKEIVVTGCLPDISPKRFEKLRAKVVPIRQLEKLDAIIGARKKILDVRSSKLNTYAAEKGFKDDYYIQIAQGCVNSCSYCAIRKAKGYVKSMPIAKIVSEVRTGLKEGHRRFVLLADDCGSYGIDIGTDFAELMNRLSSLHKDARFNIHYLYPGLLLKLYPKFSEKVWKSIYFMNIPVQTVSKRILKLMDREYDLDKVLQIVGKIRKLNKKVFIETHVIIGFPTETLQETRDLMKLQPYFDNILFFAYSVRSGTKAAKLKAPTHEMLKKRLALLCNWMKEYGNFENGNHKKFLLEKYGILVKRHSE